MFRIEVDYMPYDSLRAIPTVSLWYPRVAGGAQAIEIDLMDVRAADSLRVSYDFERDGWVIKQASRFEWHGDDEECDSDWQEVAFIQAWGRAESDEDKEVRLAQFEANRK